jgi:hypothetical protein
MIKVSKCFFFTSLLGDNVGSLFLKLIKIRILLLKNILFQGFLQNFF